MSDEPETPCVCDSPGWCEHHARNMPEGFWQFCRTKPEYYEMFQKEKRQKVAEAAEGGAVFLCHFERVRDGLLRCARCGTEVQTARDPESMQEPCPSHRSIGIGDTIAKVTRATGLNRLVDKVAKKLGRGECGCKSRQRRYNDRWRYV